MPDPENPQEQFVRKVLEHHGFTVTRLDASPDRKRPDFLVEDEESKYLIEVKGLGDPEQELRDFLAGRVASLSTPTGYDDRLFTKARRKRRQITAEDPDGEMFHILWFVTGGVFHEHRAVAKRIGDTMYGMARVGFWGAVPLPTTTCMYARPSFFYRFPEIDGVMVASESGARFYLNEFSERYEDFKTARLGKLLASHRKLEDPASMVTRGGLHRLDPTLHFRSDRELEEHLTEVFGHPKVVVLDLHDNQAMMMVPDEE